MTFVAPFSRVITRPFGGVPSSAWWLSGGIAAANCVAAYQPKGAADLAASLVNLTGNTTYNAVVIKTPLFATATGWTNNLAKGHLSTGITPSGDMTFIVRVSNYTGCDGSYRVIIGSYNGSTQNYNIGNYITGERVYFNRNTTSGALYAVVSNPYAGVLALAGNKAYVDGVLVGTTTDGGTYPTAVITLLGTNNNYTTYCNWLAGAIYNTVLTAEQIVAVTNAMKAL